MAKIGVIKSKIDYDKKDIMNKKREISCNNSDWFCYDWVLKQLNKDTDIQGIDRIGFTDDGYELFIVTDDFLLSDIPHFHYRKKEKGKPCEFHTCIRFDKPEYYFHTCNEMLLNDKQKESLLRFLRTKYNSKKYSCTYWERLIMSWNHQNDYVVCVLEDAPIPDYRKLDSN